MKTIKLKESDLQRIVKSVVNESAWSEEEGRPVSFTSEDREMLRRIYDVVVRGGSAGGYGGVRKRAIPALGTLPELRESFDYDEEGIKIKEQREGYDIRYPGLAHFYGNGSGHILDNSGSRVEVLTNNGFDSIEDKEAIQVMTGVGTYVRVLPNLMEFPNLYVVNFLDSTPLRDIDVGSILNHKNIARVAFNYEDSPIMNSKVNELENRAEKLGMVVKANKVEREQRR
tara:strand:+ start:605 stop:1288 length:684 start_codon:yes stop_codon:yes gene_type:complete